MAIKHLDWLSEPNWSDFTHLGYACAIRRTSSLVLCGYVCIPSSHPWADQDRCEREAEVHGGITWHDPELPEYPGQALENTPGVIWIGFDCSHYGDLIPADADAFPPRGEVYRTWAYVKGKVEDLAEQAGQVERSENALSVEEVLAKVSAKLGAIPARILRDELARRG